MSGLWVQPVLYRDRYLSRITLARSCIIAETEAMNAQSLPQIHMLNRPSDGPRFKDYLP